MSYCLCPDPTFAAKIEIVNIDDWKANPPKTKGLKSKVGLAAAKTAAMRINLNIDGCGVVAPPVHSSLRAPHLLANLLAHNLPLPAPLTSVRWPDSNVQAAAGSVP